MTGNGWYPQNAGGLEKYQYGLARTLTASGASVDYFCTGRPTAWDERARTVAIAEPGAGTLATLVAIARAYARAYREPYDVVDLHFAFYALPLLPRIGRRTPRVVHFHGPWALESRAEGGGTLACALKAALERYVFARADRFVTLSTAFATILHESYGVARERIDVIPMGIDCDVFTPADRRAVRERLGWTTDRPIVFTARRMVHRVGVTELLEAYRLLRRRGIRLSLKIAGRGPLLEELRASVVRDGLGDDVEFLGFVSEERLIDAYRAADVTLLPTQSLEGFGTIIAESLACGTPAIGTPVGGIVETLAALDPSLLARSATPEAIADLMDDFANGRLAVPDAARCRLHAEEHFAWPKIAQRNVETYRRAARDRDAR
ncbi:MAG: glycosyltransferase family 4 protein [Vulcanimicrobiaceae bacterium]